MDHRDKPTATHPHHHETTPSAWIENKSHFPALFATLSFTQLCICLSFWSWYDPRRYEKWNNNSHHCSSLLKSYEPCYWIPSCVSVSPVYQQRGQPEENQSALCLHLCRKLERTECQAAESGTAAWPCAEKTGINGTVYRGRYLMVDLWHLV